MNVHFHYFEIEKIILILINQIDNLKSNPDKYFLNKIGFLKIKQSI